MAIYGKLPTEEASLIMNQQFDMSQQQAYPLRKKDEATSLLSLEEEQEFERACKEVAEPEPVSIDFFNEMTDAEEHPAIMEESVEELKAKIDAKAQSILDIYAYLVTSPAPTNFCASLQELIVDIEKV